MKRGVLLGVLVPLAACAAASGPTRKVSSLPTARPGEAPPACPAGMVYVNEGRFMMGSPDPEHHEPQHPVGLDAFCIGRTEVTVAEYEACARADKCPAAPATPHFFEQPRPDDAEQIAFYGQFCNAGRLRRADHPINCVDATMADAYCAWTGGRLPADEEWEYAARGKDGRTYPWGNAAPGPTLLNICGVECASHLKKLGGQGIPVFAFDDGFPETAPVGSFPAGASPFGALDMAGNVEEWTASPLCAYQGQPPDGRGPCIPDSRSIRGGHWAWSSEHMLPGYARTYRPPTYRMPTLGFRCARSVGRQRADSR